MIVPIAKNRIGVKFIEFFYCSVRGKSLKFREVFGKTIQLYVFNNALEQLGHMAPSFVWGRNAFKVVRAFTGKNKQDIGTSKKMPSKTGLNST